MFANLSQRIGQQLFMNVNGGGRGLGPTILVWNPRLRRVGVLCSDRGGWAPNGSKSGHLGDISE